MFILWLYGRAGGDKSAPAQTIAEGTEGMGLVPFFFCRGKPDRETAQKLRSMIAFLSVTVLKRSSGNAGVNSPAVFFESSQNKLHKLIVEPLHSFVGDVPRNSPLLMIIDGLDEYKLEDEQHDALRPIVAVITTHHLTLRFLIASRPEPHIRQSFDSSELRNISYPICLDDSFQPVNDVYFFRRSEFDRIYQRHRGTMAFISQPWSLYHVVWLLAQRSAGQFIYAATTIK